MDVLTVNVLAQVCAVFEHLVKCLRAESRASNSAHTLSVQAIRDLLHRDSRGVILEDLCDQRRSLRICDVLLVSPSQVAKNLLSITECSLCVIALTSANARAQLP